MYKVVIIDDNPLIIQSIVNTINWLELQCEIIGIAMDGEAGQHVILQNYPHIVITDIKMTRLNGLEMIELLSENCQPKPLYIIISGYDEFEYAHQALHLGVFDFILKPIDNDVLIKTITKAIKKIKASKEESLNTLYVMEQKALRKTFLIDLLNNRLEPNEIKNHANILNLDSGKYTLLLLDVTDINKKVNDAMDSLFHDKDKRWENQLLFEIYEEKLVCLLIFKETSSYADQYEKIYSLFDKLKVALQDKKLNGYAIIDQNNWKELKKDYTQLKRLSETTLQSQKDSLLQIIDKNKYIEQDSQLSTSLLYLDELATKLYDYLTHGINAPKVTEEFIDYIIKNCNNHLFIAQTMSLQLAACLIRKSEKNKIYGQAIQRLTIQIYEIQHIDQISSAVEEFISSIAAYILSTQKIYSSNIQKAIAYIEDHATQNITLSDVAKFLGVSSVYLSGQIKKETGINFVDFINSLRIEKAKQMISETSLRIEEIAQQCGFREYPYFYQVFKRYTGTNPKFFRNK